MVRAVHCHSWQNCLGLVSSGHTSLASLEKALQCSQASLVIIQADVSWTFFLVLGSVIYILFPLWMFVSFIIPFNALQHLSIFTNKHQSQGNALLVGIRVLCKPCRYPSWKRERNGGGRWAERVEEGVGGERQSSNPSTSLSRVEGVMTERSDNPQGGQGWRKLETYNRERKTEEEKIKVRWLGGGTHRLDVVFYGKI